MNANKDPPLFTPQEMDFLSFALAEARDSYLTRSSSYKDVARSTFGRAQQVAEARSKDFAHLADQCSKLLRRVSL